MNTDDFWTLVDDCRTSSPDGFHGQVQLLRDRLAKMPPTEILSFEDHWHEAHKVVWTWPVWDAACLLLGWVGDDFFGDVRGWLICQGRQRLENIAGEPDSMVELAHMTSDLDQGIAEELEGLADEVYEEVTGSQPPDRYRKWPRDPAGERINLKDEQTVIAQFPRLAAWRSSR